jgi:hypothetical protein
MDKSVARWPFGWAPHLPRLSHLLAWVIAVFLAITLFAVWLHPAY